MCPKENIYDKYICYDDGVLEQLIAIRNMSDEEFEEHIKALKEKHNGSTDTQKE